MKVIFLDVDGVLYTWNAKKMLSVSKGRIKELKRIVEATSATIVLSSSWRLMEESRNLITKILGYHGLIIKDATTKNSPDIGVGERAYGRGWQIGEFLRTHPSWEITNYVIIDDDNDFYPGQQDHFVQTNMDHGLTKELADRAIAILNS